MPDNEAYVYNAQVGATAVKQKSQGTDSRTVAWWHWQRTRDQEPFQEVLNRRSE